jgi:hypothetical protein
MQDKATDLLEREDGGVLFLEFEEVDPWFIRFLQDAAPHLRKNLSGAAMEKIHARSVNRVIPEMARSIFTPARVEQLLADLREYHDDWAAAGDTKAASAALSAIASLEYDSDPERNLFLPTLCYTAIEAFMRAVQSNWDSDKRA